MRHLFDQYSRPENRLTHALVSGFAQDQQLLRAFILWVTGRRICRAIRLHISEQSLPGDVDFGEDEASERGLPDAWIYTDDGWALIIESKVASRVDLAQLF